MCVPVSPTSALLKRINMLALRQMTALPAPTDCAPNDDNNNTCLSPSALKALTLPKPGLRRCLFGVPKAEDNARIIREDREANSARMMKLWSWDVVKDVPETSGSWVWEKVKKRTSTSTPVTRKSLAPNAELRHHPYPGAAVRFERTSSGTSTKIDFQVPPMISPIPPTPMVVRVRTTSTSSISSTSSTSDDEDEVDTSGLSTLSPPSSSSECWSPRFATQISCSVKVQTRLTDFWRSRRSSCSEGIKKSPALAIEKNMRSGEMGPMACSV